MAPPRLPFTCPVAGVSFNQDNVIDVVEGQVLVVRHDPANPYDSNACRVERTDGAILGHLPAALAARMVSGGGQEWRATVAEVLRGETWGLRITVSDVVAGDAPAPGGSPVVDEASAAAGGDEPAWVGKPVFNKSGRRRLGICLEIDGRRALVRSDSGVEVSYPAELVKLA